MNITLKSEEEILLGNEHNTLQLEIDFERVQRDTIAISFLENKPTYVYLDETWATPCLLFSHKKLNDSKLKIVYSSHIKEK